MSKQLHIHIIYEEKQSEKKKKNHEQSIRHYQTANSYRSIPINIQTGHGVHIFACTYVHDFTHARMHR